MATVLTITTSCRPHYDDDEVAVVTATNTIISAAADHNHNGSNLHDTVGMREALPESFEHLHYRIEARTQLQIENGAASKSGVVLNQGGCSCSRDMSPQQAAALGIDLEHYQARDSSGLPTNLCTELKQETTTRRESKATGITPMLSTGPGYHCSVNSAAPSMRNSSGHHWGSSSTWVLWQQQPSQTNNKQKHNDSNSSDITSTATRPGAASLA